MVSRFCFLKEVNNLSGELVQDHVRKVKPRLRVLELVVNPLLFVFLNIFSHQLSKFRMPLHVATLLLASRQQWRNDIVALLVLRLGRHGRQRGEVGACARFFSLENLFLCLLQDLARLVLRGQMLESSGRVTPWHRFALGSVRPLKVEGIIYCFKQRVVVDVC